jgi:RNA polymerase sigma factor (sigma-70 family)
MEMDTTDLIARARAGAHNAFRYLVQGHSRELRVHCYCTLGSLQDVEDALQQTLGSAWRNLCDFEEQSTLRTWLYRIVTSRCLDALRASSRRPQMDAPIFVFHPSEPTLMGDPSPFKSWPPPRRRREHCDSSHDHHRSMSQRQRAVGQRATGTRLAVLGRNDRRFRRSHGAK